MNVKVLFLHTKHILVFTFKLQPILTKLQNMFLFRDCSVMLTVVVAAVAVAVAVSSVNWILFSREIKNKGNRFNSNF